MLKKERLKSRHSLENLKASMAMLNRKKAFTLLEVMVTMTALAMSIYILTSLQFRSVRKVISSVDKIERVSQLELLCPDTLCHNCRADHCQRRLC